MRIFKNPRVYIYCTAAILAALFFNYHQKALERAAGKTPPTTVAPDVTRQAPVVKDAEMNVNTDLLPKLYLFGESHAFPYAASLREKLSGKCSLLHISGVEGEVKNFFKIDTIPVAVLYDTEGKEIARLAPPYTEEILEKQVLEKLAP